jgi:ADP-ribose pyrophosphatase YjhB (NUDIX family)
MTFAREYPDAPRVGVGAVILDGDRVLLVKRGQAPSLG